MLTRKTNRIPNFSFLQISQYLLNTTTDNRHFTIKSYFLNVRIYLMSVEFETPAFLIFLTVGREDYPTVTTQTDIFI